MQQVAHQFRLGYEGAANASLVELIDQIPQAADKLQPEQKHQLANLVNTIVEAQQRHDTIYIADIIEYQLAALFAQP